MCGRLRLVFWPVWFQGKGLRGSAKCLLGAPNDAQHSPGKSEEAGEFGSRNDEFGLVSGKMLVCAWGRWTL